MNRKIRRSEGFFFKILSSDLLIFLFILLTGCAGPSVVGRAPLTGGASAEIVQIPLRLSNAFLVRAPRPVLVDTGTIGDMEDLSDALAERGVATSAVRLIIVTHGHADHAGLAADLQQLSRATVILGAGDLPMALAGQDDDLKPTGFAGAALKPLITKIYPELTPDAVVRPNEELDLAQWGIDGKIIAMPGHTPGSIVVLLSNHTAFVGDMIAGLYQADPAQNRKNIQRLLDLGVETFYLGHGGPVTRADVAVAFRLRP